jgi:hypothetical protein
MKPYLKRPLPATVRRARASRVSAALSTNPKTPAKLIAERDRFHRQVVSVRGKPTDYVVLFKTGLRRFPNRNLAEQAMMASIRRGDKPTLFLAVKLPDAVKGRVKGREVIWTYPSLLNAKKNPFSRTRIAEPGEFHKGSFRTITPGSGKHRLVVACPKAKSYAGGRCGGGMEVQSVLTKMNPSLAAQARPIVQEVLRMHGLSNKFRISKTSFSGFGYGDGYFVTIEGWKIDRELGAKVKAAILQKLSAIRLPSVDEDHWVVEFKGPGIMGNPRHNIFFAEPKPKRVRKAKVTAGWPKEGLKVFPPKGSMIAGGTYDTGVNLPPFQYIEAYGRKGDFALIAFGAYNAFGLIGPEQGGVALVNEKKKNVVGTIVIPYNREKRWDMFQQIYHAINWPWAAKNSGFGMRYMPNPVDKQSDMKPGELVRRIHPYDGTARAGKPIGKLLRVMQVKRHGPSTADDYIALLEDGEWVFTWNLARQGGARRNPGIDPVEGAYRASDRRAVGGGKSGKAMKRCPGCGDLVNSAGLCFRCQHPEIKRPSRNPGPAYHRREEARYKKLLRGDLKAGHRDAAEYWQGALSSEAASVAAGGVVRNPGDLYAMLKAAGVPTDHHESDLYFKATKQGLEILRHFPKQAQNARGFKSEIDGTRWVDVPFAYAPWWEKRQRRNPGAAYHARKAKSLKREQLKRIQGKSYPSGYEGAGKLDEAVRAHRESVRASKRRHMPNPGEIYQCPSCGLRSSKSWLTTCPSCGSEWDELSRPKARHHVEVLKASKYYGRHATGWVVLVDGHIVLHGDLTDCKRIAEQFGPKKNPGYERHASLYTREMAEARAAFRKGEREVGYIHIGKAEAHTDSAREARDMKSNPLLMVVPNPGRLNDEERRLWVLNDEGLYNAQQESGLSTSEFIKKHRALIDEVIANVTGHKKPAHYLAYPGPRMNPKRPSVDDIMRYESGEMSEEEALKFFSKLIRSGMVNHLQGSYGRTAAALIKQGLLSPDGRVHSLMPNPARADKLKAEARESAKFRGHKLGAFRQTGKNQFVAECVHPGCSAMVSVTPGFSYEVIGDAVAVGCPVKAKANPSNLAYHRMAAAGARESTVAWKHQLRIALDTLKMSPAMAGVMGGMSIAEAKAFLKRSGLTDEAIAKLAQNPKGKGKQPKGKKRKWGEVAKSLTIPALASLALRGAVGAGAGIGVKAAAAAAGVAANPSTDMGTLMKNPRFRQAVKLYRKFHGCEPKSVKRVLIPMGDSKRIDGREFFVSLGKAPSEAYDPPSHSGKAGQIFVHPYERKPEKVVSADGKTIVTLPGSHRVTDWIRG